MSPDTENEYERNMLNRKEEANIMSVKGTVRGVRNRVKTGIATFLQDQKKKVNLDKMAHFPIIILHCLELHSDRGRTLRSVCNLSWGCAGDPDQM